MVEKIFKVVITRPAANSLRKIVGYYRSKASPKVARKVRKNLIDETKILERLPESKPLLPVKETSEPPYRYTKKWSFKIIFQVHKKDDTVNVIDYLHDKENPKKWEKH